MTPAMTIAIGLVGFVFMLAALVNWRTRGDLGFAAFLGGIGTPLFGAAAFDLITTFA